MREKRKVEVENSAGGKIKTEGRRGNKKDKRDRGRGENRKKINVIRRDKERK